MAAQSVSDACGVDGGAVCGFVFDVTGSESLAGLTDVLTGPVKVAFILVTAFVIKRIVRRSIDRAVDSWNENREEAREAAAKAAERPEGLRELALRKARKLAEQQERGAQRAETLGGVLRSISSIVIYTIAVMLSLSEFNINLGPFIASAGIVGVAVGFGAQSLVKDFLSGIFMLIEDQYGVGDIIDVGATAGVVEEVKLRTTQIRDVNGTLWHVPNGEISRVANMSQDWARAVLDIEVAYDTDLGDAMRVMKAVADEVWNDNLPHATIIEEPEIWGVQSFGSDAIAIRLVAKVEPGEQWATGREIRRRLKIAFDEAGIEIPFPQRTVWLHEVEDEPATPAASAPTDSSGFGPRAAAEGEAGG
jgi:small-conductance mechanosensitive channel